MKTIVEPKEHIEKLWGKQRIKEKSTYRMMRYVLREECDGRVLLHNVVTGRLVVLNQAETDVVNNLPMQFMPGMEQLVVEHYLVPVDYDEHQQVIHLRTILMNLDEAQKPKGVITHYTILPTTACNARCYYCFEQGCKTVTMTEETADNVVKYIDKHCGSNRWVQLSWFGGEPTVATSRIDQICEGLQERQIKYQSDMTTNGYLLDEKMIEKAIRLWKLKSCMICVDGTEKNYNKTKSYIAVHDNPYQRVMENIGHLLKQGVHVNLRMNFDLDNYEDFADLVKEVLQRFDNRSQLQVRVHPLYGEHRNPEGKINHANNCWFEKKIVELNTLAREAGLLERSRRLPSIEFRACQAYSESSVTIAPNGILVRCPEQFGEDQATGNVIDGVISEVALRAWKQYADLEMCKKCCLLPICKRNERCLTRDTCCYYSEYVNLFRSAIVYAYQSCDLRRR